MTAGSSFLLVCRLTTLFSCLPVVFPFAAGLQAQDTDAEKSVSLAALQNPLLRAHFRGQFLHLYRTQSSSQTSRFAEVFVDRRIESFVNDVGKKLEDLKISLAEFQAIREEALKDGGSEIVGPLRRRWREGSKRISDRSDSLRRTLSFVFFQLRSKDDFRPAVNASPDNLLFSVEVNYMTGQSQSAFELIESYLFSARQTVDISDLTESNMLISLFHVSQIARLLRDRI